MNRDTGLIEGVSPTEPEPFRDVGREDEVEERDVLLSLLLHGRGRLLDVLLEPVQTSLETFL